MGFNPHACISEGSGPAGSELASHASPLAVCGLAGARFHRCPAPQGPPIILIVSRDHSYTFWGGLLRGQESPQSGHQWDSPTEALLAISLPDRNRSQGLCCRTGLQQRIHVIEAGWMLFRSIPAGSWQPAPQCFIAERIRLPRGSVPLRWERCGCFCCASCGKGWAFCKSSAQKCCCFLASSGLLPCTRACGTGTGRCSGAEARWFLQVKPLM